MRYAQILYNKAHWIFESNEEPNFASNIILVDITNNSEVQEGWDYDNETGMFTAPIIPVPVQVEPEPTIEEKILAENQYQTMLLELTNMGGM